MLPRLGELLFDILQAAVEAAFASEIADAAPPACRGSRTGTRRRQPSPFPASSARSSESVGEEQAPVGVGKIAVGELAADAQRFERQRLRIFVEVAGRDRERRYLAQNERQIVLGLGVVRLLLVIFRADAGAALIGRAARSQCFSRLSPSPIFCKVNATSLRISASPGKSRLIDFGDVGRLAILGKRSFQLEGAPPRTVLPLVKAKSRSPRRRC